MPEDIKRMRYYNGLFLQQEEFQLEQDYNVRMRRIHNARLHGRGIVWGLDVTLGTVADTVIVGQGMALDYYHESNEAEYTGREIVVLEPTPVDLSQYSGDDEIWMWIRYDESPAGDDPDRGDEPFNTIESFQIEHSLTRPIDEQLNIILARVVVNFDGSIDANSILFTEPGGTEPIRVGSGIAGARVETERLDFRINELLADEWPYLVGNNFTPGGGPPNETGIQAFADRTEFKGAVDVDADLSARSDLSLAGVARSTNPSDAFEIDDDLHVSGNLSLLTGASVSEISTDGTLADNSDTALPTEQAVRTYVQAQIAQFANDQLVGSVAAFAMNAPPTGWLECDGSDVDRAVYATLFARIGTTFGAGDGSTTFALPDLRGEFIRGWSNGATVDAGRAFGSAQQDEFQGHRHFPLSDMDEFFGPGPNNSFVSTTSGGNQQPTTGDPAPDADNGPPRTGPETRPRNVALMYCIKV
ncbi:MAG: tail fiber protein [bacterium]|nr:tail fiber protein [bacterium]